ncbi:hypothetical protein CAAN1_03S02762 [[Candida] anglica]|uniref:RING-type domain-containing protein n=1 Tax=[Candida] anglica TaxID=148631 RepID=A0ABP0EGS0_9ASCO
MDVRKKLRFSAAGAFLGIGLFKLDIRSGFDIRSNYPIHFKVAHFLAFIIFVACNCIKWLVFGSLSHTEVSNLKNKVSYTIWEFSVGFLIFLHTSPSGILVGLQVAQPHLLKYAGLFLCVLLLKCFHYLCVDRAQVVFHQPSQRSSHPSGRHLCLRLSIGLALVNLVDVLLIHRFFYELYYNSAGARSNILMAIFGFEILSIFPIIVWTTVRFALDYYESKHWVSATWLDKKSKILKVGEFLANFVRFSMTCVFAAVFLYMFTFPLHILPSSYLTFRVLLLKTRSLIDYYKSQMRLKRLTTPVSTSDLSDETCIICFDDLSDLSQVRNLKCHHSFHLTCLKTWLDCSTRCPICRKVT